MAFINLPSSLKAKALYKFIALWFVAKTWSTIFSIIPQLLAHLISVSVSVRPMPIARWPAWTLRPTSPTWACFAFCCPIKNWKPVTWPSKRASSNLECLLLLILFIYAFSSATEIVYSPGIVSTWSVEANTALEYLMIHACSWRRIFRR
jgi:hypothetical protein